MKVVTLFGSSQAREGEPDYEKARELGRALAKAGYTVCNGGYGGIMGASARGAKEACGKTIGITTDDFGVPANRWIDKEIRVKKWSDRLFKLIETGDAYVALDGGTGTLVELFVVWEMSNKRFIQKPLVVLGRQLQECISLVRQFPQTMDNPHLFFAGAVEEVLNRLKRGRT